MIRDILEKSNVADWIDLIFGYKSRGKEAENNLNVFFYVTYPENINFNEYANNLEPIETQILSFG